MWRFHIVKSAPNSDILVQLGTINVEASDENQARRIIQGLWRMFTESYQYAQDKCDTDFTAWLKQCPGVRVEPLDDTPIFDVNS